MCNFLVQPCHPFFDRVYPYGLTTPIMSLSPHPSLNSCVAERGGRDALESDNVNSNDGARSGAPTEILVDPNGDEVGAAVSLLKKHQEDNGKEKELTSVLLTGSHALLLFDLENIGGKTMRIHAAACGLEVTHTLERYASLLSSFYT